MAAPELEEHGTSFTDHLIRSGAKNAEAAAAALAEEEIESLDDLLVALAIGPNHLLENLKSCNIKLGSANRIVAYCQEEAVKAAAPLPPSPASPRSQQSPAKNPTADTVTPPLPPPRPSLHRRRSFLEGAHQNYEETLETRKPQPGSRISKWNSAVVTVDVAVFDSVADVKRKFLAKASEQAGSYYCPEYFDQFDFVRLCDTLFYDDSLIGAYILQDLDQKLEELLPFLVDRESSVFGVRGGLVHGLKVRPRVEWNRKRVGGGYQNRILDATAKREADRTQGIPVKEYKRRYPISYVILKVCR